MKEISLVNASSNPSPSYQSEGAAGFDLAAELKEDMVLAAGTFVAVPTGLSMEIPIDFEGQVRPRSGLARKHGITVLNAPGTIDADYRGEIQVLLINHGKEDFTIKSGMRIAQMVICPCIQATFNEVNELTETNRGKGGFGHTGV